MAPKDHLVVDWLFLRQELAQCVRNSVVLWACLLHLHALKCINALRKECRQNGRTVSVCWGPLRDHHSCAQYLYDELWLISLWDYGCAKCLQLQQRRQKDPRGKFYLLLVLEVRDIWLGKNFVLFINSVGRLQIDRWNPRRISFSTGHLPHPKKTGLLLKIHRAYHHRPIENSTLSYRTPLHPGSEKKPTNRWILR